MCDELVELLDKPGNAGWRIFHVSERFYGSFQLVDLSEQVGFVGQEPLRRSSASVAGESLS